MRIAHFAQFGPRTCGLYETAKDLILAERRLGHDAILIDVDAQGQSRVGLADGELVTADPQNAYDADVLVRHSLIPGKYQNIGKPIIMCLHGRPESSWRIAASSDNNIPLGVANKRDDCRYQAFVTFWCQFGPAWRSIVGDKLHVIQAPVDLDYYAGGSAIDLAGNPKILVADIWRDDVTPLSTLFGAAAYIDGINRDARMHIVGLPTSGRPYEALKPFLAGLKDKIGSASGHIQSIRDYYASCDVLVTPHTIATRVIREALTAGLPVVAGPGCPYTEYRADPADPVAVAAAINAALQDPMARAKAREKALTEFHPARSAEQFIDLCRSLMDRPRTGKKVLLDIGAHTGETVRRFYRQRPDADEYEIYCFEPDPDVFNTLFDNVGMMPNVHCVQAALTTESGTRKLTRGSINQGEGSTLMAGKLTGGLGSAIDVPARDIGQVIRAVEADYLILKMNIEGAEYELLPHLAETGLISRVDELYVQLHSCKFDLAQRIQMDQTELTWRQAMTQFKTIVFAQQKGMASFGNIGNT